MADIVTEHEREDEVNLYDCLPHSITFGTSYDYYCKYPMFDEWMYYLLECSTLNNADPDEVIERCREIASMRNKLLMDNFEKGSNPYEYELPIEDIMYNKEEHVISSPSVSSVSELYEKQ
jgi:hypothetical protein